MNVIERIKKIILKKYPDAQGMILNNGEKEGAIPVFDRVKILKKKKEDCVDWELEVQKMYTNVIIF